MNKTELIAAVAEKAELSKKDAEKALKAFTDVVAEELVKGEKIQLVGFGTFEVAEREEREGRNPKTGEKMTIAASRSPKFKAGKALKDMVNAEFMRLDKFLKVSRLIKRRTVANEACDAGRVMVNDKPAKASVNVKKGDIIEIQFGTKSVRVEVLDVQETVKKDAATELYRYL